jgi:hypothetical protein
MAYNLAPIVCRLKCDAHVKRGLLVSESYRRRVDMCVACPEKRVHHSNLRPTCDSEYALAPRNGGRHIIRDVGVYVERICPERAGIDNNPVGQT